jgi:hypothetical protein
MIGKDELENEEEPVLKIIDKRKFNVDGSLRDGVTIKKEEPGKKETAKPLEAADTAATQTEHPLWDLSQSAAEAAKADDNGGDEAPTEEDLIDAENPASFVNFLSTLVTNAAASLGAMPHPVTGEKSVDLDTGKYWIEVLSMLREKTEGNLSPKEQQLFDGLMSDLQMQYVSLSRASEEKLKAQAAQKFSPKDILGG